MNWFRRVGWILLLAGLVCALPTFNAAGRKSRLYDEARYMREAAYRNGSSHDTGQLEYAEAKAKEAEVTHGRWLAAMFGGVLAGSATLIVSFAATWLTRRKSAERTMP